MIDLRVYRYALLPAVVAVVVMAFSLGPLPEAQRTRLAPNGFDGARAASVAREIARLAPDRRPGTPGDARIARLVRERFAAIEGGTVTQQGFSAGFRGEDVPMSNVVLSLPGQSDRRIVFMAHRDEDAGDGLASSAAATAALLEMASNFSGSTHRKTLIFVSTDGGSAAAAGAKRFAEDYPGNDQVEEILVLQQPGAANPRAPLVLPWSAGSQSTSDELTASARAAVHDEVGRPTGGLGTFGQLVQLAIPSGLGEQAVLIDGGFDAVAISSAGERPLTPSQSGVESFSADSVGEFGRASLAVLLALDAAPGQLGHGPPAYIRVAGNLLPGWTIRLLTLALLLPVALAAIDGLARARRRGASVAQPVGWVAARAAPFVALAAALYFFALAGLLPAPSFPFDPGDYPVGVGESIALVLSLAAAVGAAYASRPLRPAGAGDPEVIAVAIAVVSSAAMFVLWLDNPFLALLFIPALHLWQVPGVARRGAGATMAGVVLVGGLVLPLLALVHLADRLHLGREIVWDLVLMVTGGHIGLGQVLLLSLLGGAAVAMTGLALARRAEREPASPSGSFGLELAE